MLSTLFITLDIKQDSRGITIVSEHQNRLDCEVTDWEYLYNQKILINKAWWGKGTHFNLLCSIDVWTYTVRSNLPYSNVLEPISKTLMIKVSETKLSVLLDQIDVT